MHRFRGIVLSSIVLLGVALSGSARADDFDGAAAKATPLWRGKSVAALFWSATASCDKAGDDLARRQCEGVRDGRREQLARATFVIEAEPGALRIGNHDAKKRMLGVELTGCLACSATMDGERYLVAGKGGPEVKAGAVSGPVVTSFNVPAATPDAAARWKDAVAPRLKAQLLVRVPAGGAAWTEGNVRGYRLDVVGYRVYDPCDGTVLASSPASGDVRGDKRYCKGGPVVDEPAGPVVAKQPDKPKEPEIPATLDPAQIRTALDPARAAAMKCFEAYGVPGMASTRITFNNEGEVVAVEQKGDFVDTPTGNCIEKAVKATAFPKSKRKKTTIDYPFILR